jgi:2-polyprenyl-3-methyl-5-hydroxy-6-metoxy-1,4-benzoquinol methylase
MKKHHIVTKYVADKRLKMIFKILFSMKSKHLKILDVGCGNRYITNAIKHAGYDIIGIDKVDKHTSWMEGHQPDIIMDAMHMKFKNNSFDVIIALEVIEHSPCVPEIKRVLKKGGKFICSTPAPGTDWVRHILVKLKMLEDQDFHGHDYIVDLRKIPMRLIYYKKMFLGTSQFGVLTK